MELKGKAFETPQAEIIDFNDEDVIQTSGNETPGMPYSLDLEDY